MSGINKLQKLSYSFGAVATALSYQAFATYIIFFYVDTLRLKSSLAALAMLIYGIWNGLNDPIAGFISDSTRSKWGRRLPYILFGSIPFGIIYFLLWSTPFSRQNMSALFWYFLIMICLFDTLYTIVVLNWASLFPEMFPSLRERAQVNSYRQTFGMIGLILGISLPPLIYSTIGWSKMGMIFGAIITAAYLISLSGSRENQRNMNKKPLPFMKAISSTIKNSAFLIFVSSNLLIQYAFTMVLALIPFYAKYVLEARAVETSIILLFAFITAIPMMFIWRAMAVKFGAKACYMSSILIFMLMLIPFLFITNVHHAVITSGFLGIGLAGVILFSDVLIADVIDYDRKKTGQRREGMYFGVNAFVCRFAIALEAISIGLVFNYTKYTPIIFTQTKSFLMGIRLLVAGLPILALAIAFGIMIFYPLNGAQDRQLSGKKK